MLYPEVCFFHIEKCVGSSLRQILYNYYKNIYDESEIYLPEKNLENNINQNLIDEKDVEFFKDTNYKVILCHCSFNQYNVTSFFSEKCFSITCVRNPIDRILSHYYFFDYKYTNLKFHELNEDIALNFIIDYGKHILLRLSGNTLDVNLAKENIQKINYILILETFNDDLISLNELLNNKYNIKIEMENIINNENIINYKDFKNKDLEIINKYINLIEDIEIYEFIVNIKNNKNILF